MVSIAKDDVPNIAHGPLLEMLAIAKMAGDADVPIR